MNQAVGSGDDESRMPVVKAIDIGAPFRWLGKGWRDLWQAPVTSLTYGVVFAVIGAFLLSFAWARSHVAPALVSGFLLVGPFLAINLYALSRQIERSGRVDAVEALHAWRANAGSIGLFGFLLVFALIGWERISAILFALFYGGTMPDLKNFLSEVLLSGRYTELLIAYFGIGAIVAAVVFAISVVSLPMLLDRDVDAATAVITSMGAVRKNPGPMFVWAALLAVLTAIGIATLMIGLVVIFPWLGHASWHAYREIVDHLPVEQSYRASRSWSACSAVSGRAGFLPDSLTPLPMSLSANWRAPVLVLVCGATILALGLGIRQSFGLFPQPMSPDLGWGRSNVPFAMALSSLIWGLAQPFFGAWADNKGPGRVVAVSGLLFAGGLALMPLATTPLMLDLTAGLLVGLGLSGVSFGVILGVVGRAFSPERRSLALGIAASGASFGQFLMLPVGPLLISALGRQNALLVLAGTILATVPLAVAMVEREPPVAANGTQNSLGEALREAGSHAGFRYLTAGFLACGFQVAFILGHLPAYLLDVKMTPSVGATALALIGLFNIAGCIVAGYLGGRFSQKYLLSGIYILRAVIIALFLGLPVSPLTIYLFAAGIGFLWLGTVPLTSGLVAQIFGVRFACTLFGIVCLTYQVGTFVGVWLGEHVFDARGSHDAVWVGSIALGVIAAILTLPIDERPVAHAGAADAVVPGWRAALWWGALAIICPVLALLALRGYYSPSVLIDFANIKLCGLAAVAA